MRLLAFCVAFFALMGAVFADCSADPAANRCIVSDWSDWSACTPRCSLYFDGGSIDTSRLQNRSRTVLQAPCPGAPCPALNDEGGALTQTRFCPQSPCTESYLRCQGSCVGCQAANYLPYTQSWCRCCANQDTAGIMANSHCLASQVGYGGGCQAVEVNSLFDFGGCVKAGFCQARNSTARFCEEFGYCRSDVVVPVTPTPPSITPANPPTAAPTAAVTTAATTTMAVTTIPVECLPYINNYGAVIGDTGVAGPVARAGSGDNVKSTNAVTAWVVAGVLGGVASVAIISLAAVLLKQKRAAHIETEMRHRIRVRAK